MADAIVNIHDAKTSLSKLVARAERGERIAIARAGRPVAMLGPAPRARRSSLPPDDPLNNLDRFAVEGVGGTLGTLSNREIDRLVYGEG